MKKLSVKSIFVDDDNFGVFINDFSISVKEICVSYKETFFCSFLTIKIPNQIYVIKGLKSIWELLPISTYDVYEKTEDNKIYNIYWDICYLKDKTE